MRFFSARYFFQSGWRCCGSALWLGSFLWRCSSCPAVSGPWLCQTVMESRCFAAFAAKHVLCQAFASRSAARSRNSSVPSPGKAYRPSRMARSRPARPSFQTSLLTTKSVPVRWWLGPGAVTSKIPCNAPVLVVLRLAYIASTSFSFRCFNARRGRPIPSRRAPGL